MIGAGRSDRKQEIACNVTQWARETVHEVALHLLTPDGEAARRMAVWCCRDVVTLNRLAPYFWRDYDLASLTWMGHQKRNDPRWLLPDPQERVERIKFRAQYEDYLLLDAVAFALAVPLAHAVSILLGQCSSDDRALEHIAPGFERRSPYALRARWS